MNTRASLKKHTAASQSVTAPMKFEGSGHYCSRRKGEDQYCSWSFGEGQWTGVKE